jgi:hypothetical protein
MYSKGCLRLYERQTTDKAGVRVDIKKMINNGFGKHNYHTFQRVWFNKN